LDNGNKGETVEDGNGSKGKIERGKLMEILWLDWKLWSIRKRLKSERWLISLPSYSLYFCVWNWTWTNTQRVNWQKGRESISFCRNAQIHATYGIRLSTPDVKFIFDSFKLVITQLQPHLPSPIHNYVCKWLSVASV
jgi:hypothetical protein